MPFDDPTSPVGKSIPLLKSDIERMRKAIDDNSIAAKAYDLDPGFRKASDYYLSQELDPKTRKKLPSMLLNRFYYGEWELEPQDEFNTNVVQSSPRSVSNPFNPFSDGRETFGERLKGAMPTPESSLGRRGAEMGNLIGEIQNQQGGNLNLGNVPEIGLSLAGNTIGAAGDVLGEAIGVAASPVVKSVQQSPGFLGPIAQKAGEGLEPIMQWFSKYKQENPRKAAALSAAGNIATVLPAERLLTAGKPIVKGVAEEGVKLAKGTAKATKEAIPSVPLPKSDRVADRLLQSALELNASQIRNISKPNVAGKNPFTWLRERGILGTREEILPMLDELSRASKGSKDELLSTIESKFALKESDQALDEVLKQVAPDGVPKAGLEDLANEAALLRTLPERTLSQQDKVKSLMDKVLKMFGKTGDGADNIKAQGWRNIRDKMKTFIENEAERAGVPDIKRLNKDTQVATAIKQALEYTGADQPYTKLIPIIKKMGGAGGAGALGFLAAGPLGAIGAFTLEKFFTNPKVQTVMARLLARYSESEIAAVKNLLETGKSSAASKKVMQEISEDITELFSGQSDSIFGSQSTGVPPQGIKGSPSPTTLPEGSPPVNPPESPLVFPPK